MQHPIFKACHKFFNCLVFSALKFPLHCLVFPLLLLQSPLALASVQAKQVQQQINTILKDFKENINIGIEVKNLSTGETLYQHNADRYFVPASNMKLFTAIAGLLYYGYHHTYETELHADLNQLKQGTLSQPVYIQFSGDPDLTSKDLA